MFNKWLKIAGDIGINIKKVEKYYCPVCGKNNLDYLYIGDEKSRVGYMHLWCNNCLNGIQLSRTVIPEGAKMLSFDDIQKITKYVPKYKKVESI